MQMSLSKKSKHDADLFLDITEEESTEMREMSKTVNYFPEYVESSCNFLG